MPTFYEPGELIADGKDAYLVEKVLGKGGMARVYRARDISLNKLYAVKVLDPELSSRSSIVKRAFEEEARALAQMSSEHVPNIRSLGTTSDAIGALFYVMEFVNGSALKVLLDHLETKQGSRRLGLARTLSIASDIAQALGEVHEYGVTHCDIKPDNILVFLDKTGYSRIKLIDFGVMHIHDDTRPRSFMGTPAYAGPEQLLERPLTPKVDVFGLGLVLFECLSGMPAYASYRGGLEHALRRIEVEVGPLPADVEAPPGLEDLLRRMVALDPRERPDAFAAGHALAKLARELAPADPHSVATDPNLGGLANNAHDDARLITTAGVATTDLDVELADLMRRVEADEQARLAATSDTQPAPARANGRHHATTPMAKPVRAKTQTVKMNLPTTPAPAAASAIEHATVPPSQDLPKPASERAGIYLDAPVAARGSAKKQETTPMPSRPLASGPPPGPARPARARSTPSGARTLRERFVSMADDRGNRLILLFSAALAGMIIALSAYALVQRSNASRAPAAASSPAAATGNGGPR